jgi:hypothetical protein
MRRPRIAHEHLQDALSTNFFQSGLQGQIGGIGGLSHPRFRHFHTDLDPKLTSPPQIVQWVVGSQVRRPRKV